MHDLTVGGAGNWFAQLFAASPDPVWIIEGRRFVDCNDAAVATLGYGSRDELLNVHPSKLSPPVQPDGEDSFSKAERMMAIAQEAGRHRFDWIHCRADGSEFVAEVTLSAISVQDRPIIYCVWRDITERKRNEAELEKYRRHLEELVEQRTASLLEVEARASHILESSAAGLYGIDENGLITFINPAACQMLGYASDAVIGRSAHELFHHSRADGSPYPASECPVVGTLRRGEKVRVDEDVFWHADGSAVPVMFAVHPMLREGQIVGAVTSMVDVSEQRAAAQAREAALVAAEQLARARREFLANMSHEIRTPLNGILGFAAIGLRNHQNPEKARNAFEEIVASGKRLLGVVNDILDFSKIEAGKLNILAEPVALPEEIGRIAAIVRERAEAKGLALELALAPDLPPSCLTDSLRLGQVLLNLLANAVKFTEAGVVRLQVRTADGLLKFEVSDTGIGMAPELVARLFTPFQQGDGSATRRFGGTGLGLAISKHIVELMGGAIEVASKPGVGTTFSFVIPYRAAPSPTAAPAAEPVRELGVLQDISILVVDDEELNRLILGENLGSDGARVSFANHGRAAVDSVLRAGPGAFDVVLMDVMMPEMDGYEAARRLREIAPNLPIIGQTAHALGEELNRCAEAGMVAHICKPIDPDELVSLILQYARPRQAVAVPAGV